MRILLAEDEVALCRALVKILEKNNFSVDVVHNGEDALVYLENGEYDGVILDIMMPKADGIEVLKTIRGRDDRTPVLILSAKSEVDDRILALDSGANYYLTKPFNSRELLAALRVITRSQNANDSHLVMGNISLDRATYQLSSPTGSFQLANKEYQIMELLMNNPHRVVSPEKIIEKIWGYDSEIEANVVWVYISYLKKKLLALNANIQIKTRRNIGYSLENTDD